ncbi:SDR family NAD(P)-dependent oxidoreductase [Microtetraspora sp. AC03309]|uniref:oxidoreductase n=1 Tax=Microtetraspora sp. AC03309 TaxID=2779376 RepID=UPI001E2F1DDB|nr:oxidoreductase [Microtetraspora sp. AC03309]MCC5581202.1 SDR family NAD(P)-dependent oxidoreductase [Microtetraspora sp. AC03309]
MWTVDAMPDLAGRTAVVTGANAGIGFPTALELARHGARVIVASRDQDKGRAAAARILDQAPGGHAEFERLDLADLGSVRAFADTMRSRLDGLDLLINNAGIGMIPRQTTADGFEMQLGTNHFGHFALTGLLMPLLLVRPGARVVTVASDAHKFGTLDFGDLELREGYGRMSAYGRSKLANLLFAFELQRRAGSRLLSVATHPGVTATNIMKLGPLTGVVNALLRVAVQPAEAGAVPSLYAATSPDIRGGEFVGPKLKEPAISAAARDEALARRLWTVSEELTGVEFRDLVPR